MRYVYSEIDRNRVKERLSDMLEKIVNDPFGILFVIEGGDVKSYGISPSSSDHKGKDVPIPPRVYEACEVVLAYPSFLPLDTSKDKGLTYFLNNLSKFVLPNEKVVFQLVFRKLLNDTWREHLFNMYSSYLRGNNTPFSISLFRRLQDKSVNILGTLGNFALEKEYIPAVDEKLLDNGYEFRIVVGVQSRNADEILERVISSFKSFDSHNSLQLNRISPKANERLFEVKRGLLSNTPRNILSEKELFTLITGNGEQLLSTTSKSAKSSHSNKLNIFPESTNPSFSMNEDDKSVLISQVSIALKEVGILSKARLYNEKVIEGVRLNIVQFDTPKRKNFSHLYNKRKDIQVALGVNSLSIEQGDSPGTVRFLIPSNDSNVVYLGDLLNSGDFNRFRQKNPLAFIVGVDEVGEPIYLSLSKLVHLLVAGTTGSGKSVFINSLAATLINTHTPDELQMIMIDPKMVELSHYEGFPHVREVVTDMSHAERVLSNLVDEMESRYEAFRRVGVKNISSYNNNGHNNIPYMVCVIDEYADLKDTKPEVEEYIGRLGQKSRAAGIHMVIATQRPDSKIISGRVKAVIPNAISFNLNNNTDYRTVFGNGVGGISLLGQGDGIMKIEGYHKHLQRFQGCIISTDEKEEEKVYIKLKKKYSSSKDHSMQIVNDAPSQLDELKKIIAITGETRVAPLRSKLGVKMDTLVELMGELVEEKWLFKHNSRAKGYELVASEDTLEKWRYYYRDF